MTKYVDPKTKNKDAMLAGAGQGLTFGLSDELRAGFSLPFALGRKRKKKVKK
jgi:hypothetical protein|tara:strand:- start:3255 stop:3410 length:156 start_codon:yes stop_codon:yes gene_type:complete